MNPDDLRQSLLSGSLPRSQRLVVARGLLPMPPRDLLALLAILGGDADPDVSRLATLTLESWPPEELRSLLRQRECDPRVLEYFAGPGRSEAVCEALIANPSTPGPAVAALARALPAHLLKRTLDNRNRVLESPEIMAAVRANPRAGAETLRVLREIEADFMGTRRADYTVAPAPAPLPEPAAEILPVELSLEGLPPEEEERRKVIGTRVSAMPVRDKIRYALFGNREIRAVLVVDTNKEVARAVLHSPKLGDSEVESIAAMRTVGEAILREIGGSRRWTKSYGTVHNLVRNPKTPPAVSQRLMIRLHSQDLNLMTRDKSIPDAVRHTAARLVKQRAQTRTGS